MRLMHHVVNAALQFTPQVYDCPTNCLPLWYSKIVLHTVITLPLVTTVCCRIQNSIMFVVSAMCDNAWFNAVCIYTVNHFYLMACWRHKLQWCHICNKLIRAHRKLTLYWCNRCMCCEKKFRVSHWFWIVIEHRSRVSDDTTTWAEGEATDRVSENVPCGGTCNAATWKEDSSSCWRWS